MPAFTGRDLHIDQLLTEISLAYSNKTYIADMLFPVVPVRKQSDIVPKYDQSHWFRNYAALRAPGTKSRGTSYTVDTSDHYFSSRYSFRFEIPDELRDNADEPFNMDRDGANFVSDKMLMVREVSFAANQFATGKWGTDKVGGTDFTQWSDYSNSSPLVDITTYNDTLEATIGVEGTQLVMGKQVYTILRWHPDLIDLIKYTQKGIITVDLLASLVDMPAGNIKIGRAIYTTTAEGTAEASVTYTRIWGKNALIMYTPGTPSLLTPAAGYTFVWNRVAGAAQYMKRMRDEEREVDILEGNSYFDQHRTAARAGIFLSNAVG